MSKVSKTPKYYQPGIQVPMFIVPELLPGENFLMITDVAAPGVLPYYAISNYGRIWHIYDNHFMSTSWDGPGYRIAVLRLKNGLAHTFRVHRLLMMTHRYIEGCENLMVNHINGCKTHNYIDFPGIPNPDNLEWCDGSYNEKEAYRMGLKHAVKGEDHANSKLISSEVERICELIEQKVPCKDILRITGINRATYENIKYHRCWKHISCKYNF